MANDPEQREVRPTPGRALVIGLTGGIASGKSLVATLFADLGIGIVDTDRIAHQLTAAGGAAIPDLVDAFGSEVLDAQGALDRAAMRARAFADASVRRRLEQILHGRIRALSQQALAVARPPYALLAIPLLVESGANRPPLDRILVVDCPESLQRSRALTRPGLSPDQVDAILAAQATRAERLAIADDVIDNSGTVESLQDRVRALDRRYRALAQQRPA